jgi:threonine synthase
MKYYSTNKQAPEATLEEAVVKGLAADKGLFMPFTIKTLPQEFYDSIDTLSLSRGRCFLWRGCSCRYAETDCL